MRKIRKSGQRHAIDITRTFSGLRAIIGSEGAVRLAGGGGNGAAGVRVGGACSGSRMGELGGGARMGEVGEVGRGGDKEKCGAELVELAW